mmetsp:Transcript_30093/g.33615  ORF Transcript_30093/g.33615 Transcript_30093/m.33615 type:complete len:97 (-) Transcript_30093:481-771(-)
MAYEKDSKEEDEELKAIFKNTKSSEAVGSWRFLKWVIPHALWSMTYRRFYHDYVYCVGKQAPEAKVTTIESKGETVYDLLSFSKDKPLVLSFGNYT